LRCRSLGQAEFFRLWLPLCRRPDIGAGALRPKCAAVTNRHEPARTGPSSPSPRVSAMQRKHSSVPCSSSSGAIGTACPGRKPKRAKVSRCAKEPPFDVGLNEGRLLGLHCAQVARPPRWPGHRNFT
jgi:hypothetical protein